MTIQLKRNDTKDAISYTASYPNGDVVDLTGAQVRFIMGSVRTLITNAEATIVDAENGQVEYTLTDADTLAAGTFKAEFEVTFADGKVKTFPNNGYINVTIQPNLDKDKSTYVEDNIALRVSEIELFKTEVNEKVEKVDLMQAQIDQLVIDGDSSVEAAQARVEADGTINATLKARLDKKEAEFTTQLAQTTQQKVDKNGAGQITYANLSQEVREQLTGGNTAVVGKDAVLPDNIVNSSVLLTKLDDNVLNNIGLNVYKGGFEVGTISGDGTTAPHYGRLRTIDFINTIEKPFSFVNQNGYEYMVFKYDVNDAFVERLGYFTDSQMELSGFKYKLIFRRLDNATLTEDDISTLTNNVVFKTENSILKTLETLKQPLLIKPSVKSISHQGFTDGGKYPMQTIPAFKEAGRRGYDGLEVDVRWTLDSVPILYHDRDAVALDGTIVPIPETNYDEIMSHQYFEDSTITIPTFYDYMKICKLYGLIPYVELKGWGTSQHITEISDYAKKMKFDKVIWSSGNTDNLQNILAEDENASIAYQAISTQYDTTYYTDPEGEGRWLYDRLLQNPSAETIFRIRESVVTESLINDFLELGFKVTLGTIDEKHFFEDYAHLCSYTMSNVYMVTDALVL